MAANDPQVMEWCLEEPRTLAVVGLSDNPDRPSYRVSEGLQAAGYKIVPVSPKGETILGERVYRTLAELPFPVDVVQVFRAPQYALEVVQEIEAMATLPRVLWMQEGVINDEAVAAAEALGIEPVQDRCLIKEYHRRKGLWHH